jgi:hypothetical protein
LIDHHGYGADFAATTKAVFADPTKGALVTESGCRWYRTYKNDAGSPLNVLNWLDALRANGTGVVTAAATDSNANASPRTSSAPTANLEEVEEAEEQQQHQHQHQQQHQHQYRFVPGVMVS